MLADRVQRFFSTRVILVVGWCAFLLYAYPGYMSADSIQQLNQARHAEPVSDWHPPIMAVMWRYLDMVIAGPFAMLVVQSLAFLLGTYALMRRFMSERSAAIVAAVLLVLPHNLLVMAVIWKDSQMAGFLVAAIPALLSERRRWRVLGYVLLFVATAMRYNAAAAVLPLLLVTFDHARTLVWWKRSGAACGVWVAITVAAMLCNACLTESKAHAWSIGSASVDVAGIMRFAQDADLDQIVRDHPDIPWKVRSNVRDHVRRWYHPENSFNNEFEGERGLFYYPQNPTQRDGIGALYWELVRAYPGAFLWHRMRVAKANLMNDPIVWNAFVPEQQPESEELLQYRGKQSAAQRLISSGLIHMVRAHLIRPLPFLILAIILIWFARRNALALALFGSGLVHELGVFVLAPSSDYRYSHWMVVATLLGTIILFRQRYGSRPNVERTA